MVYFDILITIVWPNVHLSISLVAIIKQHQAGLLVAISESSGGPPRPTERETKAAIASPIV